MCYNTKTIMGKQCLRIPAGLLINEEKL